MISRANLSQFQAPHRIDTATCRDEDGRYRTEICVTFTLEHDSPAASTSDIMQTIETAIRSVFIGGPTP